MSGIDGSPPVPDISDKPENPDDPGREMPPAEVEFVAKQLRVSAADLGVFEWSGSDVMVRYGAGSTVQGRLGALVKRWSVVSRDSFNRAASAT